MLTSADIKRKLATTFSQAQAETLTDVLSDTVMGVATSVDMRDLKDAMKDLAVAQTRTEERLEHFATSTEERFGRIETAIEDLVSAQKRTEERLEHFAASAEERFGRIETAIEDLVSAQRSTALQIFGLSHEHSKTREQLGGLSATVGYTLEDTAYEALPPLLKNDFGLTVQGSLIRTYLTDDQGRDLEMNIYGKGIKEGREIITLGESKSQTSKNDIDRFIRRRLNRLKGQFQNIFPVFVTYMISSKDVEAYAKENGIALYYSYQFKRRAM